MSRVVLSPRAKADLGEIWDYTLIRWGVDQAEKYLRELWRELERLAENPAVAVDIGNVRTGYRKFRVGSHVAFFRTTATGIDVVRILHQRMDFERHL
jgi:toxin ParE1/3/4